MLHLINYDLIPPGQNYDSLKAAISRYDCMQICYSCFAIKSDLSNAEIYADLSACLDKDDLRHTNEKPDKFFVCTFSGKDWAQSGLTDDVLEWLNK